VEFESAASLPRVDTRVETVAYRVVQEALSNAARHADAARVSLALKLDNGCLTLTLTDDGRGFDVAAARRRVQEGRSMGLLGMEERVRLAGGTFNLESAPTRGTRIIVTLPLAAEDVPA
jgi:two-component system sensor histidine kinase UhpB